MGMLICSRCERLKESHDGDTVTDPKDDTQMCCESCLTDVELARIELDEAWEDFEELIE